MPTYRNDYDRMTVIMTEGGGLERDLGEERERRQTYPELRDMVEMLRVDGILDWEISNKLCLEIDIVMHAEFRESDREVPS